MSRPRPLALLAAIALCACMSTYNNARLKPKDGAPEVEPRGGGCNVEIYEDGQPVTKPHQDLRTVELDWPQAKIEEQGPEGALKTLKELACEKGAFLILDLRALTLGVGEGMMYEATFATLLGDDGKPLNLKGAKGAPPDAGVATPDPAPPAPPTPSGG